MGEGEEEAQEEPKSNQDALKWFFNQVGQSPPQNPPPPIHPPCFCMSGSIEGRRSDGGERRMDRLRMKSQELLVMVSK